MTRRKFLSRSGSALALVATAIKDADASISSRSSRAAGSSGSRAVWSADAAAPNLVPEKPGQTPSYWCTWDTQAYTLKSRNPTDQLLGTRNLNETLVFKDPGWIAHSYRKVRNDLFVLYDGGWDIPSNVDYTGSGRWQLGSLEVAVDKFPSCEGAPAERLRKLNEMTCEAGWRGAGIWVAAQAYGDGKDGRLLSYAQMVEDFRERARWSHEAGIGYWKVDFGARGDDLSFRRFLVDVCREQAPGLVVEHARTCGPVNDEPNPWQKNIKWVVHHSGRYSQWDDGRVLREALELLAFSGTLRTYDVTFQLSVPTTLDRVAQLLANKPAGAVGDGGLVLCEDEVYIAAGLGCAMGILRGPLWKAYPGQAYDPYQLNRRINEAVRAVRWQRLAPAFPAWESEVHLDSRALMDDWHFEEGETGATWLYGHDIRQGAPARVSRGMSLPAVSAQGESPFVIASRHPNGAVAVATLPRTVKGGSIDMPLADVSIDVGSGDSPIGIFGQYRSLALTSTHDLGARRIWAQDLAADTAVDVTSRVVKGDRRLTLPGDLISAISPAAGTKDISNPGAVLKLI